MGEAIGTSEPLVEVRGYTFIFQSGPNEYRRLPEQRTRIFSLGESGYVVNKNPRHADLGAIVYQTIRDRLVVTDRAESSLPINEFGSSRGPAARDGAFAGPP